MVLGPLLHLFSRAEMLRLEHLVYPLPRRPAAIQTHRPGGADALRSALPDKFPLQMALEERPRLSAEEVVCVLEWRVQVLCHIL